MYGFGLAKGLAVTLKNAFRRPFTIQYPGGKGLPAPTVPRRRVRMV